MSLRLEMLQVARLAPHLLGDATSLVENFFKSRYHPEGCFVDRDGQPDLYYTVFGIEGLMALRAQFDPAPIAPFLEKQGGGDELDLVHLSCLARAWASVPELEIQPGIADEIICNVERFRSSDSGYSQHIAAARGTAYACFLALGIYQDCGRELPDPTAMNACLDSLRTGDGAFSNEPGMPFGLTAPTAAAITIKHQLGVENNPVSGEWLMGLYHPQGGFCALPQVPMPDLLSTATALHALACLQMPVESIKESCLDFIDSLWVNKGAFYGEWSDDALDCEYTFYALLALGHLS